MKRTPLAQADKNRLVLEEKRSGKVLPGKEREGEVDIQSGRKDGFA
jgi:hypothetical protein